MILRQPIVTVASSLKTWKCENVNKAIRRASGIQSLDSELKIECIHLIFTLQSSEIQSLNMAMGFVMINVCFAWLLTGMPSGRDLVRVRVRLQNELPFLISSCHCTFPLDSRSGCSLGSRRDHLGSLVGNTYQGGLTVLVLSFFVRFNHFAYWEYFFYVSIQTVSFKFDHIEAKLV